MSLRRVSMAFLPMLLGVVAVSAQPPAGTDAVPAGNPATADFQRVRTEATQTQPTAEVRVQKQIEVVFVLDTTGSMQQLIAAAKEKVWAIAGTLGRAEPAPQIRMGIIGYRDRGDDYITKATPLTDDLDAVYRALMLFEAQGGNDAPESVNQALFEAVHQMKWTPGDDVYRVIWLVGDAPPHMDYDDDVQYAQSCHDAAAQGIFVNTVQCGQMAETTPVWKDIAGLSDGQYAAIDPSGGAIVPETPFDQALVELSKKLDATRIYYGSSTAWVAQSAKLAEGEKIYEGASVRSVAQRAMFNACPSGSANFCGFQELVNDFMTEHIVLADLKQEELPEAFRQLPLPEIEAALKEKDQERKTLQAEILQVSEERQAWLKAELERVGAEQPILDQTIFDAIVSQAGTHGITFRANAPSL